MGVVHLVGSVPLDSVEEVLRVCAGGLGSLVSSYPDGEVGQRKYWTFYLPTRTYSVHSDLEAVNAPPDGQVRQPTRGASQKEWNESWWTFKLRPGVTQLTFDSLHYAEEATRSFEIFRRLRAAGDIPAGSRFQVCLPATGSAVMGFFAQPEDWPVVYDAYRRAIRAEVSQIVAAIPTRGPRHPVGYRERGSRHPRGRQAAPAVVSTDLARGEVATPSRRHESALRRHPRGRRPRLPLLLRDLGRLAEVGRA